MISVIASNNRNGPSGPAASKANVNTLKSILFHPQMPQQSRIKQSGYIVGTFAAVAKVDLIE